MGKHFCFALLVFVLGIAMESTQASPAVNVDQVPVNQLSVEGFLRNWLILGPFPIAEFHSEDASALPPDFDNDFLSEFGGESHPTLTGLTRIGYRTESGARKYVTAHLVQSASGGQVIERECDDRIGYACCDVQSDQPQKVFAYFGSDGSPHVWVNGQLILRNYRRRHATTPWDYGHEIQLRKGLNRVVVKLYNDRGWFGFQTQWFTEADHKAGFERALKSLKLRSFAGTNPVNVIVDSQPRPIGMSIPVQVSMVDASGKALASASGKTGDTIVLNPTSTPQGTVTIAMSCEFAGKSIHAKATRYLGDFAQNTANLAERLQKAEANVPADWKPAYAPCLLFLRDFLTQKIADPDESDLANLEYAQRFVADLEANRNFLELHLGESIPAAYSSGKETTNGKWQGTYVINLPRTFAPSKVRYPLSIFLHGSGGMGVKATYNGASKYEVESSSAGVPYIHVGPLSGRSNWHIDALNNMLAQIKTAFNVDEQRVYLGGHSMGGMGTWRWATNNPELFAAIEPQAGGGEPLRVARLVHVPVLAFQGERDTAVYPYRIERSISALRQAGGFVDYHLNPEAGHDVPTTGVDVIGFFNRYTRSGIIPPDPLDTLQLHDDVSEAAVRNLPEQQCVAVSVSAVADDLPEQIAMHQLQLFNAQRQGGHLASGDPVARFTSPSDADGNRTFDLLLPVDRDARPQPPVRLETLPAARALCITFRGNWRKIASETSRAQVTAKTRGLTVTGEMRLRLLSDYQPAILGVAIYEIQLIVK